MTSPTSEPVVVAGRIVSSWVPSVVSKILIVEPRAEDMRRMISEARVAAKEKVAQMTEGDLQCCAELYLHCLGYKVVGRTGTDRHEKWAIARSEDGENAGTAIVEKTGRGHYEAESLETVRFVVALATPVAVQGARKTIGRQQVGNLLGVAVVRELEHQYIYSLGAFPHLHTTLVDAARAEYQTEFSNGFIRRFESISRAIEPA